MPFFSIAPFMANPQAVAGTYRASLLNPTTTLSRNPSRSHQGVLRALRLLGGRPLGGQELVVTANAATKAGRRPLARLVIG